MSTQTKAKRGRPPAGEAGLTERFFVRVLPEDKEQLQALVGKLAGFDAPTVARAAFRLGLALLEVAPSLMLPGVGPAPKRRQAIKDHFKGE